MQFFDQFRSHGIETIRSVQRQEGHSFDRTFDEENISFIRRSACDIDAILRHTLDPLQFLRRQSAISDGEHARRVVPP
jgi:hypothetical protein